MPHPKKPSPQLKILKTETISTGTITREEGNLIRFRFNEHANFDVTEAREYVQCVVSLAEGDKCRLLLDTRGSFATATEAARKLAGNNEELRDIRIAEALIVDSLHIRILANFYSKFDAKDFPIKIFNSEDKALRWLMGFPI